MAYAEAMAHGLPIIGTTGGATVDTVPPTAGVLVEPGQREGADARAADADRKRERAALACVAARWPRRPTLPTWESTARIVASALERLA